MAKSTSWSDGFEREKANRVREMQSPGHVFPRPFSALDWSLAVITIAASGLLLVVGAWL